MKRTIAILLAIITVLTFTACGKQAAVDPAETAGTSAKPAETGSATKSPEPDNTGAPASTAPEQPAYLGKTLTIACAQLPESLIIQNIKNNTATNVIMPALYSRLYDFNENDELVPNIDTGYEWEDEKNLRVFLRDDACTATGEKITAEDVKYSFTVGIGGVNTSAYAEIEDVVVEDDYTARIVFKNPNPTFIDSLDEESFCIVSKSGVEKDGGIDIACKAPYSCTTGAYKFYEWKEGQSITLQYNENYFNKEYVPSYEFIKYIVIPDNASRCLAVQSGDADIASNLSLADTLGYANTKGIGVATFPTYLSTVLFFNCSNGIFTNPDLRKAIGYLVDWQECAEVVGGPNAKLNEASMPRASQYFYDEYIRTKDIEMGKELMAKAGYPDGFSFEITTAQPQVHHTNVALLIQAQLAEFGITVKVNTLDLGIYFGTIDSGNYEAHMSNASASFAVHMAFYDDYKTRAQNYGGPQLSDPYLTDLVMKARTEFDEAKRIEYVLQIQQYMVDNRVGYGITDEVAYALYNSDKLQDMTSEMKGLKAPFVRPVS
ncbi:MAG: ABC transporter substrate-binding protein [Clostridiales bacterium]|nr:ABC transporter substrate-binding protein [Clostridiales bacterium]